MIKLMGCLSGILRAKPWGHFYMWNDKHGHGPRPGWVKALMYSFVIFIFLQISHCRHQPQPRSQRWGKSESNNDVKKGIGRGYRQFTKCLLLDACPPNYPSFRSMSKWSVTRSDRLWHNESRVLTCRLTNGMGSPITAFHLPAVFAWAH